MGPLSAACGVFSVILASSSSQITHLPFLFPALCKRKAESTAMRVLSQTPQRNGDCCAQHVRQSYAFTHQALAKVFVRTSRQRGVTVARAEAGEPVPPPPPGRKPPPTPQEMAEKDKLINLLVECKNPDEVRFMSLSSHSSHPATIFSLLSRHLRVVCTTSSST